MKKAQLEEFIKSAVDHQVKKEIQELKAELKETDEALGEVLDIAEKHKLSTLIYAEFIEHKNLMEDFKQFLLERNSKGNVPRIH